MESRTGERPELDWTSIVPTVTLHVHTCVWRDPHGATYVVDHSGTRRVATEELFSPAEARLSRALFDLAA